MTSTRGLLAVASALAMAVPLLGATPTATANINPVYRAPDVNGPIYAIAATRDGKTLIGGNFTQVNGQVVNHIALLNEDGSLNQDFRANITSGPNIGFNAAVRTIVGDGTDTFYVGGSFTTLKGSPVGRIAAVGQLPDWTVYSNFGTGFNGAVRALSLRDSNKLVAVGEFTTYQGAPANRVARVNAYSGALDTAFATNVQGGPNAAVYAAHQLPDGRVLVGGIFTTARDSGGIIRARARLAMYSAAGALDPTFSPDVTGGLGGVLAISSFPGGPIILGGDFTSVGGLPRSNIAFLNEDGSATTLADLPTTNGAVRALTAIPGGTVIAGGDFTQMNGWASGGLAKFLSNGNRRGPFTIGSGTAGSGGVYAAAQRADAQLVIGGSFATFDGVIGNSALLTDAPGPVQYAQVTPRNRGASITFELPELANGGSPLVNAYTYWERPDTNTFGSCTITSAILLRMTATCTGMTNGKKHRIGIYARNAQGYTSEAALFTVTPRTVPGKVRAPSRTFPGPGKARVAWLAPLSNGGATISAYEYCRSSCGVAANWKKTGGAPPLRYVVLSGLTKGASYSVRIRARNGAGAGAPVAYSFTQGT